MNNKIKASRRTFVKTISYGVGALTLTPALNAIGSCFPKPKGEKLGIALVGLGGYSTGQLAPALQQTQNCYLAGIVTGTPSKADSWSKQYNIPSENIYNYQSFDRIKDNKSIDIVYVVLPVSMHKDFTIRAAKAGKHVICEKPMALKAADCLEMIAACKLARVMLSIGYRLHFEPHNQEVMQLGQQRKYGEILSIDSGNGFKWGRSSDSWRLKKALSGGGALMDMGIYAIQAARYTTGMEPLFVTAKETKTNSDLFKEVDDTIDWELEFPGGLVARGKSSYSSNLSFLDVKAKEGKFGLGPAYGYSGIAGYNTKGPMDHPQVNQQAMQMDDFAHCIANGQRTRVPGEEGWKDMKIIDAIYRSIASGRKEPII